MHAPLTQTVITFLLLLTVKRAHAVCAKRATIRVVQIQTLLNVIHQFYAVRALEMKIALVFHQLHIVKKEHVSFVKQAIILVVREVLPIVMEELYVEPAEQVTMKDARQLKFQDVFHPHIHVLLALLMRIVLALPQLLTVEEEALVYYAEQAIIMAVQRLLLLNVQILLHISARHALWTQIALIFLPLHIVKELLASIAKPAITVVVQP